MKLTIELVPRSTWKRNLRSILPKDHWDMIRHKTYRNANYRCEICNGVGAKWPVECHEIWEYDDQNKIQFLTRCVALCPNCHQVKHIGRSIATGNGENAINHLCRINNIDESTAKNYIAEQFAKHAERSLHEWEIDITWAKGELK